MDLNNSSTNATVLEEDNSKRIREDTFVVQMSQAEKQQYSAADEEHTQDGSVDFFGQPAVRHRHGGLKTLPFTLGVQFMINASMYAVVTNMILYLTENLHQPNAKAATDVTNWNGSALLFSVLGAFLADGYLGRFWTSVGFIAVYFCGTLLATFTTSLSSLKPLPCPPGSTACLPATGVRKGVFYLALYIQAIGFGSYQPCNIAFGADQFDEKDEKERRHKSLFFSLVYVASSCGGLIGNTFLVYLEQKVSYTWGFAGCTGLAGMTILLCFTGIPLFRYQKPEGNPLTRVSQVVVATIRKWNVKCPADESQLFETCSKGSRRLCHTQHFRFLDRAAFVSEKDIVAKEERRNGWRLCTVTQVEEVKFLMRILPIWASSIFYSTLYVQILTLFIEQASTLDLTLGSLQIPAASVSVFETLSVCFWAFAYEKWVVPLTRRLTGNPRGLSLLQRMGTGMVIATIAMVAAAVFEIFRLRAIKKHHLATDDGSAVVPITFFWLLPQYFLVGASEAFAFVGQYEFFYDQAPEGIRGVGSALQFTSIALGNFISGLLVSIVSSATKSKTSAGWLSNNLNTGHLDYFYWVLVMLSSVNFAIYVFCARSYKYSQASYIEPSDSTIAL